MNAVRLYEYGPAKNLHYETDVPDPQIADDQVLIATAATSINPIDWKMRSGAAQERYPLTFPAILGRDVSGIVRAIGKDVQGVSVGDRVMAFSPESATYASLVAIKAVDITHTPEGLNAVEAAALPLVILTGDQLVREGCALQPDQSVIVTGALGSVGRAAVHSALTLGAKVIAGVRSSQVDEAKELGAHGVLAMDDEEARKCMGTVDAIADTTGDKATTPLLNHVREGGVCATVVTPPPDVSLHPGVRLARVKAHPDPKRVRAFAEDYRDGKFKLPIVRRYALHEAVEAQTFAEKGGTGGKILLLVL